MRRTLEDIQDELLVLRCQEGDAEAMTALIARWHPRFIRLAWRLTGRRETARDLVQDTWLSMARGIRRLEDPARFRSWACRILANKCADWTRRQVVRHRHAADLRNAAEADSRRPAVVDGTGSDVARLRAALARLPEGQAAVLVLHYLEGMSVAEIAVVLSVPQGTVKSRLDQARQRLKQAFERVKT